MLWRKMVTAELQLQIESANIPGMSLQEDHVFQS